MRLIVLLSVLVSACAPGTRTFDPMDEWTLQREFDGRPARVVLDDGRRVRTDAVRIDPDSSSWVDARSGAFEVVPTASIVLIERPRSTDEGVRYHLGASTLAGALTWGTIGFVAGSASGGSEGVQSALWLTLFGTAQGALTGIATGLIAPGWQRYRPLPTPAADEAAHRPGAPAPPPLAVPLPTPLIGTAPALGLRASDPLTLRTAP